MAAVLRRFEPYFEPVTKRLPKSIPGWRKAVGLYRSLTEKKDD